MLTIKSPPNQWGTRDQIHHIHNNTTAVVKGTLITNRIVSFVLFISPNDHQT